MISKKIFGTCHKLWQAIRRWSLLCDFFLLHFSLCFTFPEFYLVCPFFTLSFCMQLFVDKKIGKKILCICKWNGPRTINLFWRWKCTKLLSIWLWMENGVFALFQEFQLRSFFCCCFFFQYVFEDSKYFINLFFLFNYICKGIQKSQIEFFF